MSFIELYWVFLFTEFLPFQINSLRVYLFYYGFYLVSLVLLSLTWFYWVLPSFFLLIFTLLVRVFQRVSSFLPSFTGPITIFFQILQDVWIKSPIFWFPSLWFGEISVFFTLTSHQLLRLNWTQSSLDSFHWLAALWSRFYLARPCLENPNGFQVLVETGR